MSHGSELARGMIHERLRCSWICRTTTFAAAAAEVAEFASGSADWASCFSNINVNVSQRNRCLQQIEVPPGAGVKTAGNIQCRGDIYNLEDMSLQPAVNTGLNRTDLARALHNITHTHHWSLCTNVDEGLDSKPSQRCVRKIELQLTT